MYPPNHELYMDGHTRSLHYALPILPAIEGEAIADPDPAAAAQLLDTAEMDRRQRHALLRMFEPVFDVCAFQHAMVDHAKDAVEQWLGNAQIGRAACRERVCQYL